MKIEKDNSLSIQFGEGIGQSVFSDFSDIMGVNIDNQGILNVGYRLNQLIETKSAINFTIVYAGASYFDLPSADKTLKYAAVKLSTTGTLPTGLNTTDTYFLWDVNGDGKTFRFSEKLSDIGNSWITLSDTGTGTHSFTRVTPEIIKDYTFDSYNNLYLLDSKQRVWFSTNYQDFYLLTGNTSSGNGNGIIYYSGYILVFGNSKIDALAEINDISTTLSWTNNFASGKSVLSSAVYPKKGATPFYSQYDNAVYFGNGVAGGGKGVYRIGLIEEVVGQTFNPASEATWDLVPDVIETAYDAGRGYAQTINEVGEYLVFGTGSNIIYYWDRKSMLPNYFVNMPENNTTSIVVRGSQVFAFNGYNGKFYQITTSDYGEVFEIPEHLFDIIYTEDNAQSNDRVNIEYIDATIFLDEILFSIEVNGKAYLMSYNILTKNLTKKNISSYGETLTDRALTGRIYKIINLSKSLIAKNNIIVSTSKRVSGSYSYILEGWQQTTGYTGGNYHRVYDNDEAYIITGLTSVGDYYNKKTLRELQVSFTRALSEGQSVKIYYRRDDNSAWVALKTIDYTTYGAIKDLKTEAPITDIIDLQIKIVINGYNGSTTGTSPYLKLVRLIP